MSGWDALVEMLQGEYVLWYDKDDGGEYWIRELKPDSDCEDYIIHGPNLSALIAEAKEHDHA